VYKIIAWYDRCARRKTAAFVNRGEIRYQQPLILSAHAPVWDSSTCSECIPLRFKEPLGSQPTLPHAAALSHVQLLPRLPRARRASPQGSKLIKVTALRAAISGVAAWQRGNIAPRRRLSAQPPLVRQIDKLKSLWSRENVQEECAPREYATGSSRYKSSLSIFTSRTTGPPCDRAIPYVRSRPCEFSSLEREFLAVWRTMALQC
jgi:hypothetical protein